jgi:hypothetical protein
MRASSKMILVIVDVVAVYIKSSQPEPESELIRVWIGIIMITFWEDTGAFLCMRLDTQAEQ